MFCHTVFLDIDGVLSDFCGPALKIMGVTEEQLKKALPPGPSSFYITSPFMSDDEFWALIDGVPDFWENLPKTKEADKIVEICMKYFGKEVYLLTKPPHNPLSYAGKAVWVRKYYPQLYRSLFVGPRKHAFAHPGAVLVDDNEENCDLFCKPPNGKPGGSAVLVPRRGNSLYAKEPNLIEYVDEELKRLKYDK